MRNLIKKFVETPFYANLIIAVLIGAGVMGILNMKKSFFPEIVTRFINITVAYPGASPKEMEESITVRIEEAVRGIVGIKELNSVSSENISLVNIETTGDYDIDETLMEVKNAVDGISSFPVDAEKPIVFKVRSRSQVMTFALSGDVDLLTLKYYANKVENDMLRSGKVTQIAVSGHPPLEISVEVSEENLLRHQLTFDQISAAIQLNNRDISGGDIKSKQEEILIRSRERSVDPGKIGGIIIRGNADGSFLRIRDIGEVKVKFADQSSFVKWGDKNVISFTVTKLPEQDLEVISAYIEGYMEDFNGQFGEVQLTTTFSFLTMLKGRLALLYSNGGIGLLLVIIVLALFLNLRLSFWVAMGIPASFLAMFIVASIYGITINMISLFGMILVIGILVDDGIVIAENIFQHFEKGKTPRQAAIDGTMEVLPSVVTSVLTTIVAFTPVLLLEGKMEFLFEMAFVVVFSLGFSLLEAFFVLPAHLGSVHVLRQEKKVGYIRSALNKSIRWMRDIIYQKSLLFIIRWKYVFLVVPIALFLITAGLLGGNHVKKAFFPRVIFDSFTLNVAYVPGTGEERTVANLERFDSLIWATNEEMKREYKDTADYITNTFKILGSSFDGQEKGAHAGSIMIFVRESDTENKISTVDIAEIIRTKIGTVSEAEKFTIAGRNRFGSPVSVGFLGDDIKQLQKAKWALIDSLKTFSNLKNIKDDNAIGKQEVQLKLKPKAYFLGLNLSSISHQVRQGFYGGQSQRLQDGKDELRVWVRYPKQDRLYLGQLDKMKIKTPQGNYPLTELVDYEIRRGPVNINHYNGQKEIRVEADLVDFNSSEEPIIAKLQASILPNILQEFPGVEYQFQGQKKDGDSSQKEMMSYFLVALIVILFILMINFTSVSQAIIVMMMIPLGIIGSIWGHGVEGILLSMLSAWGIVALSGVIINDAVVFLARYNENLKEKMSVRKAVIEAGLSRFRPILLTTITTSVGLYPLILERSFQAQFLKPMAVSLAYGVFIGTMFILTFFPVLILVLNDLRVWSVQASKWIKMYANVIWNGYEITQEDRLFLATLPSKEEVEPVMKRIKRKMKD